MNINLSLLKNIDFTNKDNLLFLSIFFIIFIIFVFIAVLVLAELKKIIKRLTIRIFNIDFRRPKFDKKKSLDELVHPQNNEKETVIGGKIVARGEGVNINSIVPELIVPSKPIRSQENIVREEIKMPTSKKIEHVENKKVDSSIFAGESEVSRIKLEHEMRTNSNVWQAAKQTGVTLTPVERAKLVKEVFSSAYGRNISKTDLKSGIRKLNQKMLGTKDMQEHAKIRKEIKFFKKIGGV